jgi:hypothetical protein
MFNKTYNKHFVNILFDNNFVIKIQPEPYLMSKWYQCV